MKKNRGFRLDELAVERLDTMADATRTSRTELLESLIHACFDSYWHSFEPGEFGRLERSLKDRLEMAGKEID